MRDAAPQIVHSIPPGGLFKLPVHLAAERLQRRATQQQAPRDALHQDPFNVWCKRVLAHVALDGARIAFLSREIHSETLRRSAIAQKEVAMAQSAMLDGKMGTWAAHLGKAMHAAK